MYQVGSPLLFAAALGFFINNMDTRFYGSLTLTVFWSVCVDLHAGVLITVVLFTIRALLPPPPRTDQAAVPELAPAPGSRSAPPAAKSAKSPRRSAYEWASIAALAALVALGLAIRAHRYDFDTFNLIELGLVANHFSHLQTPTSHKWIERQYAPFQWQVAGDFSGKYSSGWVGHEPETSIPKALQDGMSHDYAVSPQVGETPCELCGGLFGQGGT